MRRAASVLFTCLCCAWAGTLGYAQPKFLANDANPSNRENLIEFVEDEAPSEDAFVAVQRLAAPYLHNRMWAKAVEVFTQYKPKFPGMEKRFDKIIVILNAAEEGLVIENVGTNINTSDGMEFAPVPSADGKRLYFAARDRQIGLGGEDIYVSALVEGRWFPADNLGPPINTNEHDAPVALSADGNRLILFGNYEEESLGRGDLFYTDKTEAGAWGPLEHFPEPINSADFEAHACTTPDGKAIIFASDRPGGQGEYHPKDTFFHGGYAGSLDLWVCLRTANGWSAPINLGQTINTPYAEYDPFLHPDGRTLYFSSDGHPGLGRMDVFFSTRLSDTSWTEWSEPVNLGKEINTPHHDRGYKITTDGTAAYCGRKDDIYKVTVPVFGRPKAVATLEGIVQDTHGRRLKAAVKWRFAAADTLAGTLSSNPASGEFFIALNPGSRYVVFFEKEGYVPKTRTIDLSNVSGPFSQIDTVILSPAVTFTVQGTVKDRNGAPLGATLAFDNLSTAERVNEALCRNETGEYKAALPSGINYGVVFTKEGYYPESRNIDARGKTKSETVTVDIVLTAIEDMLSGAATVRINNVFFDFAKADLQTESFSELRRLALFLQSNPTVTVEIAGHTDTVGTEALNIELSTRRALAVREYLVKLGVKPLRMQARGYGFARPVASNLTEQGRAMNRRVEVRRLAR